MRKVLIINPHYLPGYKSGGPQQTIQNICDLFSKYNDIYIVTQNVDLGETTPYDLDTNVWLKRYGVNIMYVEPKRYKLKLFRKLYNQFDIIYACGLFCKSTIDFMMIKKKHDNKKLYVAPMGVFSKNALAIRAAKKKAFLAFFSVFRIFRKIVWSFTSNEEWKEAIDTVGEHNIQNYIVAEDLPRSVNFELMKKRVQTYEKPLRIIFLSRIVPKKNLLYAIKILNGVTLGDIVFDIYGFQEDHSYWEECSKAIGRLPSNVICNYCGGVNPKDSINTFSKYDIFLFPTQGENFGHVIYESLASGCIPIISNTTPWDDLEDKNCGRVINLDDVDRFRKTIEEYLEYDKEELIIQKLNAIMYAEQKYMESITASGYRQVFDAPINNIM